MYRQDMVPTGDEHPPDDLLRRFTAGLAEVLPVFRELDVEKNILSTFVHLRSVAQEGPLRWPSARP
jgi:hypothetical protein